MSRPSEVQSRQSFGDAAGVDYMAPTRQRSPEERLVLAVLCDAVDSLSHASKQIRVDAAKWIEDRTEAPWSFAWACGIFGFDAEAFRWKLRDRLDHARGDDAPAYTRRIVGSQYDTNLNVAITGGRNIAREQQRRVSYAMAHLAQVTRVVPLFPATITTQQVRRAMPHLAEGEVKSALSVACRKHQIRRLRLGVYTRGGGMA